MPVAVRRLLPVSTIIILSGFVAGCLLVSGLTAAHAANGDCSIPVSTGEQPKTSDCLFILRAAVGIGQCQPCVCDTNDNDKITAADALVCLKVAVGQDEQVSCPPCVTPGGSCPDVVEWVTRAGEGPACSHNSDCAAGVCSGGRCRTDTSLDLGWTGSGHHADLAEGATLRVELAGCEGSSGGACGECSIAGIDAAGGSCRCENNWRASCDEAFVQDHDDCPACFAGAYVGNPCTSNTDCDAGTCSRRCSNDSSVVCRNNGECPGGGSCVAASKCSNGKSCFVNADCTGTCTGASACQCFDGPPLPLSVAGVPLCLVSRFGADVTGTVDVDTGESRVVKDLRIVAYSAASVLAPCPVCGGTCSNDAGKPCLSDSECGLGNTCSTDPVAGDGVRGGVCQGGASGGESCDVQAIHSSLPVYADTQGGGYSLDCTFASGSSANGAGAAARLVESTGTSAFGADLPCGGDHPELSCPCRVCSTNSAVGCHSDADCAAAGGTCTSSGPQAAPQPNQCDDRLCSATGNNQGQCTTGPDDMFCDGAVQAGGGGIFPCISNADCDVVAMPGGAGSCSLLQRRACFLDPIVASGTADPSEPTAAANFCVSTVGSAGRNAAPGLPGPARVTRQSTLHSYCATDRNESYEPGAGGCPP